MNLSETEPLQVMLSSRASDEITFEDKLQELSVLRRAIKARLESLEIGDVFFSKASIGLTGKGRVLAMGSWDFRPDKSLNDNAVFLANLWSWLAGND